MISFDNCKEKIVSSFEYVTKSHQAGWDDEESHEKTKEYLIGVLQKDKMLYAGIDSTLAFDNEKTFLENLISKIGGDHAVTITGMQNLNGQCYFQIRDSAIESTEFCNKQKLDPRIACIEDQDYLIPEDIFLKSIKISSYIK